MATGNTNFSGLRALIIQGMTRQQQISYIIRKDTSFSADSLAGLTDKQVKNVALTVDKNVQANRQNKKLPVLRQGGFRATASHMQATQKKK